jgi:hypothetical protein
MASVGSPPTVGAQTPLGRSKALSLLLAATRGGADLVAMLCLAEGLAFTHGLGRKKGCQGLGR